MIEQLTKRLDTLARASTPKHILIAYKGVVFDAPRDLLSAAWFIKPYPMARAGRVYAVGFTLEFLSDPFTKIQPDDLRSNILLSAQRILSRDPLGWQRVDT